MTASTTTCVLLARGRNAPQKSAQDLNILAEVLGPARAPERVDIEALDIPEGTVEVVRRRVTRDGRIKLKLSLLGVAVDRCQICLAQFKDREEGVEAWEEAAEGNGSVEVRRGPRKEGGGVRRGAMWVGGGREV